MMTTFDYIVLAIIGLSVLMSIMRGFIREFIALLSWVVAFFVAREYSLQLLPMLPQDIPTETLKTLAAFLIVFLATLLLCSLLGIALSQLIKKIGLGWVDRAIGGVFGFVRGVIVVGIMVLLAGFTTIPQDQRWRDAMFSAPLEYLVTAVLPWMPEGIAKHVKFE